jgi:hypothetical protein
MYLKTKTIVVMLLLIIAACKPTDSTSRMDIDTDQAKVILEEIILKPKIPFKTLLVERAPFRFDFQGQMRSLRSTLHLDVDSFANISLITSLGISVAQLYLNPNEIVFIDFQEKKAYAMDYEYLSIQLQIPVTFNDLQMLILGYPFIGNQSSNYDFSKKGSNVYNYSYKVPCEQEASNFFTKTFSLSATDKRLEQAVFFNSANEERLSSSYKWSMRKNVNLPQSILIDFVYNDIPIGIDLEYKNSVYDLPIDFKRDSTIFIKRLQLNDDF